MKPVMSIVPLQSRNAATVSNARLQAIRDADQRARLSEGQIPEGYADQIRIAPEPLRTWQRVAIIAALAITLWSVLA